MQQASARGRTGSGSAVASRCKSARGCGAGRSSRQPVTPLDSAPEIIEEHIVTVEENKEPKKSVQKARCGKPFSNAGITHKFKVTECSIALDTEDVEREKHTHKIVEEKDKPNSKIMKKKKKDKPKSDITEQKKEDKPKSDITEQKKEDKPKSDITEQKKEDQTVVEYVKPSDNEEILESKEQPSTSTSIGFEMSTCGQTRDEQLKVIQASLEIKRLESEIEKLLFARSEVKNCEKRIETLRQVLLLLSKDIIEEEIQKKKHSEGDPDMQKKEHKLIETNGEEKEKEDKPEKIKPNLRINTTPKPKVKKTVTFEIVEEKEENKINTDVESAIATLDADIDNTKERIDEEYINFPSSQLDSIKDKRPKYFVQTEDISDEDEENKEEKMKVTEKKEDEECKEEPKTIESEDKQKEMTGIQTFVKSSAMPEVDKEEEPEENEEQPKESEKESKDNEKKEDEECKEEPKTIESEDRKKEMTGIQTFVKSSAIPEVDKKEETSVDKEPKKDKTELSGKEKDMQNEKDTQNDNNGLSCGTTVLKKTEQNVEENKDKTENNSEEIDKEEEDETEDKSENAPSDDKSDQDETVPENETEPENEAEAESASTQQVDLDVNVDGLSDKKPDVDEEEDVKDEKKEKDGVPVADLFYTDK